MKRRNFVALLGGAAATPLMRTCAALAQQTPVVGILRSTAPDDGTNFLSIFRQGLQETGYSDKNARIDFRMASNVYDRLPVLAAELVRNQVAVLVASGAVNAALAAQAATTTIPIVFIIGSDPVQHGLVASLSRPGGNVTGVTLSSNLILEKRLELLRELIPDAKTIGLLVNPTNPNAALETRLVQTSAARWNLNIRVVAVSTTSGLDSALASLAQVGAGGFLHTTDVFFTSHYPQLVPMAARHRLATIYGRRDGPAIGGLASYGARVSDTYRLGGAYAGRILGGTKPADLPVQQPTQFDLAVNLKSAQALGITVPTSILLRANEVIE